MGWGVPGNGRPAAPRWAGRGEPLSGSAAAWRGGGGAGQVVETSWHSYGAQDAANCARGGVLGQLAQGRTTACIGVRGRSGRDL
jgi:hypothetical protein